jgi:hypothetical protein
LKLKASDWPPLKTPDEGSPARASGNAFVAWHEELSSTIPLCAVSKAKSCALSPVVRDRLAGKVVPGAVPGIVGAAIRLKYGSPP